MKLKFLAEMQRVVLDGGGDYPANEYIIGSGQNALLCRYQSEKRNLVEIDQLILNGLELINIIILQCLELFQLVK